MSIQITTKVLPGGRIEVTDPKLKDGAMVTVTIDGIDMVLHPASASLQEYVRSLPKIERTPEEWEEIDRQFRAERDAWD
jgi:hypothetical protein